MGYLHFTGSRQNEEGDWDKTNEISTTPTFWNGIAFKKSNKEFRCGACDKYYEKGTRYLGDNWERVCMFCAEEWISNSIKCLDELKDKILSLKPELKENYDKWSADCVVGEL